MRLIERSDALSCLAAGWASEAPGRLGILCVGLLVLYAQPSTAHSVIVWAEIIDDEVLVEGYLSTGERVTRGRVLVVDQAGDTLARGRLNSEGRFIFALPQDAGSLTIKVVVGPQHAGSFLFSTSELQRHLVPDAPRSGR